MLNYIEINKSNLIDNIKEFRRILPSTTEFAAVIKANAYGHDQNLIAKIINNYVDYFQVDDFFELKKLKDSKIKKLKPILVLGYISRENIQEAISYKDVILSIYNIETLKLINDFAKKINKIQKVHICIDSHLGRDGILNKDLEDFLKEAKKLKNIKIDGIYSHFANIEDTSEYSHAIKQINEFEKSIELFSNYGFNKIKTHISATSGALSFYLSRVSSKYQLDIARIGIGIYGMWPSENLSDELNSQITLKPVLKWISHIAQIKTLPENHTIGYGLTYTTSKSTAIAIIPIGYSDGYDRNLSNIGEVLIQGKRCKILGRISMNMMAVEISNLENPKIEEEVVLLGQQEKEIITAEEIAKNLNRINYEITTLISPFIPRVLKN